jgi:hypothetical protein
MVPINLRFSWVSIPYFSIPQRGLSVIAVNSSVKNIDLVTFDFTKNLFTVVKSDFVILKESLLLSRPKIL